MQADLSLCKHIFSYASKSYVMMMMQAAQPEIQSRPTCLMIHFISTALISEAPLLGYLSVSVCLCLCRHKERERASKSKQKDVHLKSGQS